MDFFAQKMLGYLKRPRLKRPPMKYIWTPFIKQEFVSMFADHPYKCLRRRGMTIDSRMKKIWCHGRQAGYILKPQYRRGGYGNLKK